LPSGAQEYTPLRPQKGLPKFAKNFILPRGAAEFLSPDVLLSARKDSFMVSINSLYWCLAQLMGYASGWRMSENPQTRSKLSFSQLPLGIITILIIGVIQSNPG
jgi:hypothetical protein